jgi:hypothetical protein
VTDEPLIALIVTSSSCVLKALPAAIPVRENRMWR